MPIISLQKMETKLKRPLAEIPEIEFKKGLSAPPNFPWLKAEVSSEKLLPTIQSEAPLDGKEMVKWMHFAMAEGGILDGACEDYNRIGSLLVYGATDPYIPGIKVGDLTVRSITGESVQNAGGCTIITPKGNFNVPLPGKATGIFSNILSWGRLSWAGTIQWILSLLQWQDLASTPIKERVRFANLNGAVAPQFFIVKSQLPPPVIMLSIGFTSNRQQQIAFQMRNPGDFTNILGSDTLDIPAGEGTIDYLVLGFPFVEPFVAEFQPEDGTETILDSLTTTPP